MLYLLVALCAPVVRLKNSIYLALALLQTNTAGMHSHLLLQIDCSAMGSGPQLGPVQQKAGSLCISSTLVPSGRSCSAYSPSRQLKPQRKESRLQLSSSSRDSPQLESQELDVHMSARPWSFDVPTMREMQTDEEWPKLVTDWELFWTRLTVWQQYVERSRRKNARPSQEYEEWWELDTPDTAARTQKVKEVEEVLNIVADRMPQILEMGFPVPDHVPFYMNNLIPEDHDRQTSNATQLSMFEAHDQDTRKRKAEQWRAQQRALREARKPYWEQPPWLRFHEWDFRAYVEKKRQAEAMRKDFMRRQAQVSKYRSMNVSIMTDSRVHSNYVVQTGEAPVHHTHEEYMDLITNGGKSVHPNKVHYRIKDPLEKVDWFQSGAHSIPETEDFLRIIGHFADNDHDLHAYEEEGSSSTLNEAFEDLETAMPESSIFADNPAAGQDAPLGSQDAGEQDETYGNVDAEE